MDAWRQEADEEMARLHPKRYAAPRMSTPPEPVAPPEVEQRQLPRTVSWGRVPSEDVVMADEWIRSVRWLVAYRALAVDEDRSLLGSDRLRSVGPERRPVHR